MSKSSWDSILTEAYASLDAEYQRFLEEDKNYFPNKENYFNAFSDRTLTREKRVPEDMHL